MPNTLDITPSPRVLRMLGQIDFAPWQCLAELIDNSIDAFLDQQRAGQSAVCPHISVSLPTIATVESGNGVLKIEDNAAGMSLEQLRNAVKAGYSGNDPVDKMGLFGMGFNISTARLGRRTEVWTTTTDSTHWTKIIIDFDELERSQTFHAPIDNVPKTEAELATPTHGTRILISRLEPNRTKSLIWGAGKAKTKKRLGKIYGRVMDSLDITISYDGDRIPPWRHCTWDSSRSVPTAEFGNVPARIEINVALQPRKFCRTCWVWLTDSETVCNSCGHADDVLQRSRNVRGWIGVQRYFDKEHFGFDLIRNGRVIEDLDKSFFTFRDPSGDELFEYPRDAVHWGGRLVGELEIDFVRVSHQKDSFDKLDPEWKHVVTAIRGDSPLQPKIADRMGLPRNTSPLARLFAGYRKGIAGLKDLVPADANGVGLNAGPVREYVEKFYAGEADYQDDSKWYELVRQAERVKRGESAGADDAAGELPLDDGSGTPLEVIDGDQEGSVGRDQGDQGTPGGGVEALVAPTVEQDLELSNTYELSCLPGSPAINVKAYRHKDTSADVAFAIQLEGFKVRYDYYPKAKFFEESLQTPIDCLIVDLAQHFLTVSSSTPRQTPVSWIAHELRKKYFPQTMTNVAGAADAAEAILNELRAHYDESLSSVAPIDLASLDPKLVQQVRVRAFQSEAANEAQVERAIRDGEFARFIDADFLIDLVKNWPTVASDGKYFSLPYETISPELREDALSTLVQALSDLRWLSEEASGAISKDANWRLRFARALASLRLTQSWIA
jgi:hypothetical protein